MKPTIKYDSDCQIWEASLPPGFRFASGPHLLIEPATGTVTTSAAPAEWKREGKQTLLARIAADRIIECHCEDCE